MRKIENLKDGTEVVGSRTRVKVVKNKVAPPFRQCEFDIMYGKGISREGSLLDVGVDLGIIKKSGAWFTYEGEQLGQGRENARAFLAEHTDVRDEIERKIREAVGITAFGEETRHRSRSCPTWCSTTSSARRELRHGEGQAGADRVGAVPATSTTGRGPREPRHPKSCHERALGTPGGAPPRPPRAPRRLLAAGFETEEVSDVLARLERVGLIDDEAFALQMAEYQFASRRAGSRAVTSVLLAKGIAPALAAAAAADAPDDEAERALELAGSRARRLGTLEPGKAFQPVDVSYWSGVVARPM